MPRLFFAIRVPPNPKIEALLQRLGRLRGVKAVAPQNIHYTLRFLGDVSDEKRDQLVRMFENATFDQKPFEIHICGTGTFPPKGKPSVVWLGCTENDADPLQRLADKVDAFAEEVGLGPRDKPFVPHLTLARVKRPEGRSIHDLKDMVAEGQAADFGPFRVEQVQLVQSHITDTGPIYTDIAEVPLK